MSKFKVGDKVACYDEEGRRYGYIVAIDSYKTGIQVDLSDWGYKQWFHIKQCRKLFKKSQLHPQDPRGYKNKITDSVTQDNVKVLTGQEHKFKVGDFVWDSYWGICRISDISSNGKECSLDIPGMKHDKVKCFILKKLNIKIEE